MRSIWIATSLLSLAGAAQVCAQAIGESLVPVVVAVDTSRSLTPQALGMVNDRLRRTLEGLPADTPTGLIAFDDELRWVHEIEAGPAVVAQALDALAPQGGHTLLHDALFVAAQALDEGGVVLLATDGRDENSATTVEDIARRSEAQSVRIVSVGTGGRIDVLALRRLALLSGGAYLGRIDEVDAAEIVAAVRQAQDGIQAERARISRPAPRTDIALRDAVATDPTPAATPPEAPEGGTSAGQARARWHETRLGWFAVLLAASSVAALIAAGILWRRGRATQIVTYPDHDIEREPAAPGAAMLRQELLERPIAPHAREVTETTAPIRLASVDEPIETTGVLIERSTVTVREPGKEARAYELDREQAFAVGRKAVGNTLSILDPALSSHHFRIVPTAQQYYFIDVESTNGSSINGAWVSDLRELRSGDVIRAGLVEFEFQSNVRHLITNTAGTENPLRASDTVPSGGARGGRH